MRQLMGINVEKILFWTRIVRDLFRINETMRDSDLSLRRHPRRVRLRRCGSCRHLRGRTAFQADIEGRTRYDGVS